LKIDANWSDESASDLSDLTMILPPLAVPMDEEPSAAGGRRSLEKNE